MAEIISFEEAIDRTEGKRRHLVLGNGFSIALFPDRFRYGSLLDQAKKDGVFESYPELLEAFEILQTTDFEMVLEALIRMTRLIHLYVGDSEPKLKMLGDVERLKEALVQAVAGSHPARLNEIDEGQFERCRAFLSHFCGLHLDKPGSIYTLNYDLLLYWVLMHEPEPELKGFEEIPIPDDKKLKCDDGFREPDDNVGADYVAWSLNSGSNSQNIHYLHGGLHIFDAGFELQKYCWERAGGIPLMDQIKSALDVEYYPVFVSEGDSDTKLEKILHNGYLTRSYKSLAGVCSSNSRNTSVLFIYGHSLAAVDDHILRLLEDGQIREVYISIFGAIDDEANKTLIDRAARLGNRRDKYDLKVVLFDAQSAMVWN